MRIRLPRRPPRDTPFGQWCNELLDVIERIIPQSVPGAQVSRTTRGTFIIPDRNGGGAPQSSSIDFEGEWTPKPYPAGAIVIRSKDSELDDGNQAGTYISNAAVNANDQPPGSSAEAYATITGGAITGITVSRGGTGYLTASVVIYGDGAGAVATARIAGGAVTGFDISAGGAGYTQASVKILSPEHKWDDFALFRARRFTFRSGQQRIVLDCGRNKTKPSIEVFNDYQNESAGGFRLNLGQIPASAGFKVLEIHEDIFCVFAVGQKKMLWIRSEYYD